MRGDYGVYRSLDVEGGDGEDFKKTLEPRGLPQGYLALFGVALLWGSYTPAIRYIFLSEQYVQAISPLLCSISVPLELHALELACMHACIHADATSPLILPLHAAPLARH